MRLSPRRLSRPAGGANRHASALELMPDVLSALSTEPTAPCRLCQVDWNKLERHMRTFATLVVLGIIGPAAPALAEAWRAKPALEVGSPPACSEADVSHLFFDLSDTGTGLSVKPSMGGEFSAPIKSDGSVNTTFALPVGTKSLPSTSLEM
jgi:hypothetical protein